MSQYSLLRLVSHALRGHRHWPRVLRAADPKPSYDVVIIGGGGHGLATAYFLARQHGIRRVAVLERTAIGHGNSGRNTQVSRPAMINVVDARIGHVALPTEPGQCIGYDPAILWLAPDGWLLVSEQWDGATLAAWARPASHGRTAAVVDVSDSLVAFMLEGPRAGELLARGTGLDAASLVPGSCTRTRLAQLPVFVRSLTPERIELLVDRGPAAWLREWFIDAGGLL